MTAGGRAGQGADRLAILHVVRQFLPNRGGLEDFVANLAREQVRLGHAVRVLTLDRLFPEPDRRLAPRERIDGIDVERLPFRGSSRYPLAPGFLGRLRDADIVHVHAVDFFFDALALTKVAHRKPLVATTHGGFFHTGAHARLKRLWFQGPTRLSARAYGAIVGCGASDACQFDAIVPAGVAVIENGVDLDKFAHAASPTPRRALLALCRFSHNKRLDRLIATMRVLHADAAGWRLAIAGVPSDLSVADVSSRIAEAGLSEAVSVHAGLDAAGVRALIGQSSLFASASEYEGFGIALIEAMSAGLAPVVHPNASFADLAARHPGIALGDFADPRAAAQAVREAYAALAARGRPPEWDLSRYAWTSVAGRYLDTYARVIRSAGRPGPARSGIAAAADRGR